MSYFKLQETWDEAEKETSDDLVPIAVKLVPVPDLPPIDVELGADHHYPYVLACMTTWFSNPKYDGKLGWFPLEGKLKQDISQLLHDNDLKDEWVFLSQVHEV